MGGILKQCSVDRNFTSIMMRVPKIVYTMYTMYTQLYTHTKLYVINETSLSKFYKLFLRKEMRTVIETEPKASLVCGGISHRKHFIWDYIKSTCTCNPYTYLSIHIMGISPSITLYMYFICVQKLHKYRWRSMFIYISHRRTQIQPFQNTWYNT